MSFAQLLSSFSIFQVSNCTPCSPGTFSADGETPRCTTCAPGQYTALHGSTGCIECPAGRSQYFAGMTSCKVCDHGKYVNSTGSEWCKRCPHGSVVTSSSTLCVPLLVNSSEWSLADHEVLLINTAQWLGGLLTALFFVGCGFLLAECRQQHATQPSEVRLIFATKEPFYLVCLVKGTTLLKLPSTLHRIQVRNVFRGMRDDADSLAGEDCKVAQQACQQAPGCPWVGPAVPLVKPQSRYSIYDAVVGWRLGKGRAPCGLQEALTSALT